MARDVIDDVIDDRNDGNFRQVIDVRPTSISACVLSMPFGGQQGLQQRRVVLAVAHLVADDEIHVARQ